MGAATGAAITGSAAGAAGAAALFLRSSVIDGGPLVIGSAMATGILAAAGTWLSERRQPRASGTSGRTPTPYD